MFLLSSVISRSMHIQSVNSFVADNSFVLLKVNPYHQIRETHLIINMNPRFFFNVAHSSYLSIISPVQRQHKMAVFPRVGIQELAFTCLDKGDSCPDSEAGEGVAALTGDLVR